MSDTYHHGNLRQALIDAGIRIINESNSYIFLDKLTEMDIGDTICQALRTHFTADVIHRLMSNNPCVRNIVEKQEAKRKAEIILKQNIIERIPENIIDLYPLARRMHRKFILHIGPTNSGKTYSAMEEMKKAGKGVYLAPLRLLAFEQFERMNAEGYPCSLITGEERSLVDGSRFTACTIEMASYDKIYPYAVIDEAQMLSDPSRGGSWTASSSC